VVVVDDGRHGKGISGVFRDLAPKSHVLTYLLDAFHKASFGVRDECLPTWLLGQCVVLYWCRGSWGL